MPPRDSLTNTIIVALVLCLVCSLAVSLAAVSLKPTQDKNALLDMKKNILDASGLAMSDVGATAGSLSEEQVGELFKRIEEKVVDLKSGDYADMTPEEVELFDPRKQEKNVKIEGGYDVGPSARGELAKIYIVNSKDGSTIDQVVLPIYGDGLWSTLYGFLALDKDLQTVKGITFYEHAETPGLGGEVDNPSWKAQWQGLSLYDSEGQPAVGVSKGPAPMDSNYLVDGLSGATITARGVNEFVRYWVSENGFQPYLQKLGGGMKGDAGNAEQSKPEGASSNG